MKPKQSRRSFLKGVGTLCAGGMLPARAAPGNRYDLIVVGVGSGGFGAALAGARLGLRVLCLEIADEIGGNAVRSGVSMWEAGVGGTGFPFEIYKRLKKIDLATGIYSFGRHIWWVGWKGFPGGEHVIDPKCAYRDTLRRHPEPGTTISHEFRKERWHGVVFEPDIYARTLRRMLRETGRVTLWTETTYKRVEVDQGMIRALDLTNGRRVTASVYVDGTGAGYLSRASGCTMLFGQESKDRFGEPGAPDKPNDRINGVTQIFRIAKTDSPGIENVPDSIPEACWWGKYPAMSAVQYPNGDYNCNMLPTMKGNEFWQLGYARARVECGRRVRAFWRHVQKGWPEFQNYRIKSLAPALGVREDYRVLAEYVLKEQDLLAGIGNQDHEDIITIADHSFDLHGAGGRGGEVKAPYGVPYRCLIPMKMKNLLVACRGAGFSSIAASSCRLSRTMMQLGQAAGTAAAIACEKHLDLPDVPATALRTRLRKQHVQLGWPTPPELAAYLENE